MSVDQWLGNFEEALASGDAAAAAELFADDSYWRDLSRSPGTSRRSKGRRACGT